MALVILMVTPLVLVTKLVTEIVTPCCHHSCHHCYYPVSPPVTALPRSPHPVDYQHSTSLCCYLWISRHFDRQTRTNLQLVPKNLALVDFLWLNNFAGRFPLLPKTISKPLLR